MVAVVYNQVVALAVDQLSILASELKHPLRVSRVLSNLLYRIVVTNNRLIVMSPCKAAGNRKGAAGVIHRDLVSDSREPLLAGVAAHQRIDAAVPANVGDISRPHRPREPHLVKVLHHLRLHRAGRKKYMLFVELLSKVLAELVERRLNRRLRHVAPLAQIIDEKETL